MTYPDIEVHDVIESLGYTGGRLYSVQGIHLGALNQENVVELIAIDRSTPDAHGTKQRMFVPMEMLHAGIAFGVFNLTKP